MRTAIKYIYNHKGQKYGVAVAALLPGRDLPNVGLARCNMKADNFSKKKAVMLATARALEWGTVLVAPNPVNYPDWNNDHLEDYLEKFTSTDEEFKFMKAIDFVIKQVTPKEQNAESNGGN